MLLRILKAKIHRATLTRTDVHYEGSIAIDEDILDAPGILPHEQIAIWNVSNGARLTTHALAAERRATRWRASSKRLTPRSDYAEMPLFRRRGSGG